mgnify:FL=1
MSSQIYTVGHQTLDVPKSNFLNYVIQKEDLARTDLFRKGKIQRAYNPVLQILEREEKIINSKQSKNQETQGMKDSLSTSFRNNVDVLNGKRLYVYCVYVLYIVYCL